MESEIKFVVQIKAENHDLVIGYDGTGFVMGWLGPNEQYPPQHWHPLPNEPPVPQAQP